MQIIPVINCNFKDDECVLEKILKINHFSKWVHLDIADGIFTFNKTWNEPFKWKEFNQFNLKLEVHLMVENPINLAELWLNAGAEKIIFHWESFDEKNKEKSISEILNLCKKYNAEVVLAVNPETPISEILNYLDKFNCIEVLSVMPGLSGQKFLLPVLDKIKLLKEIKQSILVEVDGGINLETAKKTKEVGADILASGTYIFKSDLIEKSLKELEAI